MRAELAEQLREELLVTGHLRVKGRGEEYEKYEYLGSRKNWK